MINIREQNEIIYSSVAQMILKASIPVASIRKTVGESAIHLK